MNYSNGIPWDTFTQQCTTCQQAVELAKAVAQYDDSHNVSFVAIPVTRGGRRLGEDAFVVGLTVRCNVCNDKRRLLTDEGKKFVALCESLGLITGVELEKRLEAARKGGNNET